MTPKCILFDLDGTLTDSGEGIINCAVVTLEYFGLPVPPRDSMRSIVGPPLRQTFSRYGVPEDRIEEAIRVYRSRYTTTGIYENFPYPGIREVLSTLKEQGHRLFVATSKPEHMAKNILKHFEMDHFFEIICGAESDSSRETKDAVIAYLLDQLGQNTNCIMVGDTAFDVIGAKAHSIPTVGVSWGYGEVSEMDQAGAASIAYTMEQLLEQLNRL